MAMSYWRRQVAVRIIPPATRWVLSLSHGCDDCFIPGGRTEYSSKRDALIAHAEFRHARDRRDVTLNVGSRDVTIHSPQRMNRSTAA